MVKPNYASIHPKSASWLAPLQPAPLTDYGPVVQYANSPVTRPIVLPFLPQRQPLLALIFTCLLRDGQAELNCVTGYIPRWFFRSRSPNKLLTRQRTAGSQARAHQAFCWGGEQILGATAYVILHMVKWQLLKWCLLDFYGGKNILVHITVPWCKCDSGRLDQKSVYNVEVAIRTAGSIATALQGINIWQRWRL